MVFLYFFGSIWRTKLLLTDFCHFFYFPSLLIRKISKTWKEFKKKNIVNNRKVSMLLPLHFIITNLILCCSSFANNNTISSNESESFASVINNAELIINMRIFPMMIIDHYYKLADHSIFFVFFEFEIFYVSMVLNRKILCSQTFLGSFYITLMIQSRK